MSNRAPAPEHGGSTTFRCYTSAPQAVGLHCVRATDPTPHTSTVLASASVSQLLGSPDGVVGAEPALRRRGRWHVACQQQRSKQHRRGQPAAAKPWQRQQQRGNSNGHEHVGTPAQSTPHPTCRSPDPRRDGPVLLGLLGQLLLDGEALLGRLHGTAAGGGRRGWSAAFQHLLTGSRLGSGPAGAAARRAAGFLSLAFATCSCPLSAAAAHHPKAAAGPAASCVSNGRALLPCAGGRSGAAANVFLHLARPNR